MAQENYARCLANTLREEGGFTDHPRDPGGPTMRGIIQREYSRWRAAHGLPDRSVRFITEAELQDIYAGNYWRPMLGHAWPKGPDQIVFDIAVNSGTGAAPKIMAHALGTAERSPAALARLAAASADQIGIVKRACARRASFYRALRTFPVFGRGWLARNARMEAIGVRMVLEAQAGAVPAEALACERAAAAAAAARTRKVAATAGGGATAAGGTAATADPAAWDVWQWLGAGALGLMAVLLVAGLAFAWLRHRARTTAYAAALAGRLETSLDTMLAAVRAAGDRNAEVI